MLTRTDIRRETNATTYARGRELYDENHVLQIKYDSGEYDYIDAEVIGSKHKTYHVNLA